MGHTVTGFDGKSPPSLMPAIGSFTPKIPFKVTISGTTTSESIVFSQLKTIRGVTGILVLDSGNNVVAPTGLDITFSGNVLTLADGGSFDLDTAGYTIYGDVWGDANA